jgi:hypothetical protein
MAHLVANYFSWNPVGATRAGRNPATYKDHGKTVHIDGKLSINWEYNSMTATSMIIFSIPFLNCLDIFL